MQDKQIKLVIGSLLHDIGKVVYRTGDSRQHSISGYDFLKDTRSDFCQDILDCVRYHHAYNIRNATIDKKSPAYITYFSDNVAAAMDRREKDEADAGFDRTVPLSSVFNILNGNQGTSHYKQRMMDPKEEINYPSTEPCQMDETFYNQVIDRIKDNLQGMNHFYRRIYQLSSVGIRSNTQFHSIVYKQEGTCGYFFIRSCKNDGGCCRVLLSIYGRA